ncbi:50S ribosomal protein L5 [Candidatus Acetothermia bacterium]|jgi:large subunit ribosomal protein L5|nr:50S ribosomal protein L5 [Candidatus Acetothermia bacterium]MCI2426405.1 50S ribosomal protein L5 [Candidatus Acetothermia bacterium]MCI2427599.1 50S ribosomal protein L5 [Candidatus Acetothermia bacterium]MCI2428211.1 50S ribosomal protein L5 [Candidatus Acetothermia bacterium]
MLQEKFKREIIPQLMEDLAYVNVMQVPRLEKIIINMGVSAKDNPKILEGAVANLTKLSGQRPLVTRARKSISDFRITKGDPIGCKVTLRRRRAYALLEKLINAVLPGIRDFKGLSAASFDGRGNYTVGIQEQLIFPEISYEEITAIQGMDITIVTTAKTDREGYALLKSFGMPFTD